MFQSEKNMTFVMLLVPLVWALSGVSAKYLSFYISEDEVVVYRFFLSVVSTLPLLIWMKIPMRISLKNFVICFLLAFFLIGNYRTYFMGMQRGAVGLGAALVTVLIPIFVYIMMIFSKKSKLISKISCGALSEKTLSIKPIKPCTIAASLFAKNLIVLS